MLLTTLLNNRFVIVFLVPFLLGVMTVLTFQPFNITILNFFIFPLLFLVITYVNKKSRNIYRKKPFLSNLFFIGHFFGFGFFLSGTYWISYSLTFDENFKYLIPFSVILLPFCLGFFYGIATLISGYFLKKNISSVLIFCSMFASVDFIRSKILTGFPWNLWSYSWSWIPEVIQVLNPIGLFAFNLITISIFCSPLLLVFERNKSHLIIFFTIILIFFSNYIYGFIIINKSTEMEQDKSINVKIVSPSFDLKYDLKPKELSKLTDKLKRYSEPSKKKNTIFVWPEGVYAGYSFFEIQYLKDKFKNNFSKNHVIVFGVNTVEETPYKIYNSFIAVNNNFEIIYKYNKKKLVPFGEFLPLEKYLNKFGLKKITQGSLSFSKGSEKENFKFLDANIMPLICYEIIFTELIQKMKVNTNLIINISEDAWFGGSIGPHQHFSKAIFRAIESNSFIARSANQGISAFINNKGKVIKILKPYEKGNIELNIPLINSKNKNKNKNDLIFFILLFTYMFIFFTLKKFSNDKK